MNNDNLLLCLECLMKVINVNLKDDVIILVDVGIFIVWFMCYLNLFVNNKFIIFSWLGIMGCGLLGVMVVKIVYLNC